MDNFCHPIYVHVHWRECASSPVRAFTVRASDTCLLDRLWSSFPTLRMVLFILLSLHPFPALDCNLHWQPSLNAVCVMIVCFPPRALLSFIL